MFQPWHLDNTKLFYVWVFGASGYVALVIHRWIEAGPIARSSVVFVGGALGYVYRVVTSGAISFQQSDLFYLAITGSGALFLVESWPAIGASALWVCILYIGASVFGMQPSAPTLDTLFGVPLMRLYVWIIVFAIFAFAMDVLFLSFSKRSAAAASALTPARLFGGIVAVATFIALTFSGALATWREMLNYAKLYDDIDFDVAEWIKEKTPTNAIFLHDLTMSNHIRIESSLAGRQVACGFAGWLHSHGIDSGYRRSRLMGVMQGLESGVSALSEFNITHITVDAGGKQNFDYAFLDDVSDFVATAGKYSIFEVTPAVARGWAQRECVVEKGARADRRDCLEAGCWYWGPGRCMDKPRKRTVSDCGKSTADSCRAEGCLWIEQYPGPWCQKPLWKQKDGKGPEKIKALHKPIGGSDWCDRE